MPSLWVPVALMLGFSIDVLKFTLPRTSLFLMPCCLFPWRLRWYPKRSNASVEDTNVTPAKNILGDEGSLPPAHLPYWASSHTLLLFILDSVEPFRVPPGWCWCESPFPHFHLGGATNAVVTIAWSLLGPGCVSLACSFMGPF